LVLTVVVVFQYSANLGSLIAASSSVELSMSLSGALGLISISMLSISDRRGSRSSAMNLLFLFFPQTAVRAAAVVKQMVVVDRVEVEDAVAIQKSFLLRSFGVVFW